MRRRDTPSQFQGISSQSVKTGALPNQQQPPQQQSHSRVQLHVQQRTSYAQVSYSSSSSPSPSSSSSPLGMEEEYGSSSYQSTGYQRNNGATSSVAVRQTLVQLSHSQGETPNGGDQQQQQESHLGAIRPNYYNESRRAGRQQLASSNWIYQVISEMLAYIYSTFSQATIFGKRDNGEFPQPQLVLDFQTQRRIDEFKSLVTIPYDKDNSEHEDDLVALWNVCMPHVQLTHRISQQWKELGFQGSDPATDFRGGGIFGLRNILYFAKKYPKQFQKMFQRCQHSQNSYPFVIAGLNVTMLLFDLLGWGLNSKKAHSMIARKTFATLICGPDALDVYWSQHRFAMGAKKRSGVAISEVQQDNEDNGSSKFESWAQEEDEQRPRKPKKQKLVEATLLDFGDSAQEQVATVAQEEAKKVVKKKPQMNKVPKVQVNVAFEEVYCCAFRILDKEWYQKNATYFNFPTILADARARMEDLLESTLTSLDDVTQFNKLGKV